MKSNRKTVISEKKAFPDVDFRQLPPRADRTESDRGPRRKESAVAFFVPLRTPDPVKRTIDEREALAI